MVDAGSLGALVRLEPAAVEAFYRTHLDAVYAFVCHRVGGDRAEAEDVTQETFMTALHRIHTFDGRSSLSTWVMGIAKNKAHEHLRRRGRLRPSDRAEQALSELAGSDLPSEVAATEWTAHVVGAALAELPPHYRDVLEEKYVQGKSLSEMATQTGRSFKSVESMVQRARTAFADAVRALARAEEP